jgi:hypothetical protein
MNRGDLIGLVVLLGVALSGLYGLHRITRPVSYTKEEYDKRLKKGSGIAAGVMNAVMYPLQELWHPKAVAAIHVIKDLRQGYYDSQQETGDEVDVWSKGAAQSSQPLAAISVEDFCSGTLTMNKRPRSITIIGWICIVFGTIALGSGLLPSAKITAAQRLAELAGHWYVHVSRAAMIVAGVFMLYGFNWARWLLILWFVFHVIVGFLHSPLQGVLHTVIFIVPSYFLFRPAASAYFRDGRGEARPL